MEPPTQTLSAAELLALWETARPQHLLDRALTILAAAPSGATRDALADLSIGERDARLLQLRVRFFRSKAEGFAECPQCAERIEFPLDLTAFYRPREVAKNANEIEVAGRRTHFRLPTSRDLAQAVAASDAEEALHRIVRSCLSPNESELPNEIAEKLSQAILESDPQAEIILQLSCPACGHAWELLFDIWEFFWTEIAAQAQSLLREIDALARAYGWTESEILRLPAQRRQTYLGLVAA